MFTKPALTLVTMLGASLVDAHMIMTNPVPYGKVTNSPVEADGSNFPCKDTTYSVTQENHIVKGQPNTMQFEGGATHGGGSCQISITKDRAPTKDTQWSVIESIEGGCMDPSEGQDNLSGNPNAKAGFAPSYTVPESFDDGEYTLAWTWINRIGNREFYMNCAPVTLSSGSSTKRSENTNIEKRAEDYPPMFIANINGCKTEEGKSPRYPNPGPNVESYSEAYLIASADDVCSGGSSPTWGDAGMSSGGGSAELTLVGGSSGASGAAPTGAASTEPAPAANDPATEPSTPAVSIGGAVQVQPTEPAAIATPSSTFEPAPAAPTAAPTSSPNTSAEGAQSGACTDEGAWNCISGTTFQRCASGTWTDVQTLSSGTECTPGQGANFAVKAVGVKARMLKEKRRRSTHLHNAHA